MISVLKKSFLIALACVCAGAYGDVEAQGARNAQTRVSVSRYTRCGEVYNP